MRRLGCESTTLRCSPMLRQGADGGPRMLLFLVCILLSPCFYALEASQLVATPSNDADSFKRDPSTRGLNPSVVIIVVILTVVFFLSGFLHLLARCCGRVASRREPTDSAMSALHGQLQHLFHLHDSGVDQAFIDTLPVFPYKAICGLKEGTDCAVCLSEFEGEDRLRLLPKCKHAFHLDCIDTWLLSHSTCPLCRCSLLPDEASPIHANFSDSGRAGSTRSLPSESIFFGDSRRTTDSRRVAVDESHSLGEHPDGSDSDTGKDYDRGLGRESPEIQSVLSRSESIKSNASSVLSVQLGRVGKAGNGHSLRGRSYSMGSYEYIVDPSNLQVVIAPTPYPGRGNIKADIGRPRHRSVFSDSIPEIGSIPCTPCDELFWASRGLANINVDLGQEFPPRKSSSRSLASLPEAEVPSNPLPVEEVERKCKSEDAGVEILVGVEKTTEGEFCFRKQSGSENSLDLQQQVKGVVEQQVESEADKNTVSNRTFSFRFPVPDVKNRASKSRRTKSETTGMEPPSSGLVDNVWLVPMNQQLGERKLGTGNRESDALNFESSSRSVPSIARKSIHWLMGREKRIVFAAFSPSPDALASNETL